MKTPKNFLTVVRGVYKFGGWEEVVGGGGAGGRFMLNNILKYIIFEFIFSILKNKKTFKDSAEIVHQPSPLQIVALDPDFLL